MVVIPFFFYESEEICGGVEFHRFNCGSLNSHCVITTVLSIVHHFDLPEMKFHVKKMFPGSDDSLLRFGWWFVGN